MADWVWWVCFSACADEIVDFDAGMRFGGFVLRHRICGGFGGWGLGFVLQLLIVGWKGGPPRPRRRRSVGSFCFGARGWCALVRRRVSARNAFCKLGHSGTFWDIG